MPNSNRFESGGKPNENPKVTTQQALRELEAYFDDDPMNRESYRENARLMKATIEFQRLKNHVNNRRKADKSFDISYRETERLVRQFSDAYAREFIKALGITPPPGSRGEDMLLVNLGKQLTVIGEQTAEREHQQLSKSTARETIFTSPFKKLAQAVKNRYSTR
jgi:hypothetical protein